MLEFTPSGLGWRERGIFGMHLEAGVAAGGLACAFVRRCLQETQGLDVTGQGRNALVFVLLAEMSTGTRMNLAQPNLDRLQIQHAK